MTRFKSFIVYALLTAMMLSGVLRAFADEDPVNTQEEATAQESCKNQPGGYCKLPEGEPALEPTPTPEPTPEEGSGSSGSQTMEDHEVRVPYNSSEY